MESRPLLRSSPSEEKNVTGNHRKRRGKMFTKTSKLSSHNHLFYLKSNSLFFPFFLQNEEKKRKLSDTTSDLTEMKVKYLRYNVR